MGEVEAVFEEVGEDWDDEAVEEEVLWMEQLAGGGKEELEGLRVQ